MFFSVVVVAFQYPVRIEVRINKYLKMLKSFNLDKKMYSELLLTRIKISRRYTGNRRSNKTLRPCLGSVKNKYFECDNHSRNFSSTMNSYKVCYKDVRKINNLQKKKLTLHYDGELFHFSISMGLSKSSTNMN